MHPSNLPLPAAWIDRIFDRLHGLYGSLWSDRWRSGITIHRDGEAFDRGTLSAKAAWAEALGGFHDQPHRLAHALKACQSHPHPPTLPEFLSFARQAPAESSAQPLPAPEKTPPSPETLARLKARAPQADYMAWARKPPQNQTTWERFLVDGAQTDDRLREILKGHVESGVCKSPQAVALFAHGEAEGVVL
jgi:hypothetical protein